MSMCLCGRGERCSVCDASWARYQKEESKRMAERSKRQREGKCKCSWAECICDQPELWPTPKYEIGQRWKFYGGGDDTVYTIKDKTENQLLLSYVGWGNKPRLMLVNYHEGNYARNDTPQLRIRVK